MANYSDHKDWQWTDNGVIDGEELIERIRKIVSPYTTAKPPVCYPGTTLEFDERIKELIPDFLAKQLNSIGTHTHGKLDDDGNWQAQIGEGGFDEVHAIECQVIWMIADLVGGLPKLTDGYFCGGATEANIQGLWVGREWLRQRPDPLGKGIAVLTTPLVHYSIIKGSEILDLGHPQWTHCPKCLSNHIFLPDPHGSGVNMVGMNKKGEMDVNELRRIFQLKYQEGFRRFIVVPTIGTTLMGSVDPIKAINEYANEMRHEGAHTYIHVDAAFGGFTLPFVAQGSDLEIGFQNSGVMSMALDGDKMGQMPYPAGVFLCRKELQRLVAMKVNYIRGHEDDTLSGSRSALAAILAWLNFKLHGKNGQKRYVQTCLANRNELERILVETFGTEGPVKVLPTNPYINLIAIEVDIRGGQIPENLMEQGILQPYHLRRGFFPSDSKDIYSCPRTIYKLCIMPHNTGEQLRQFVEDLQTVVKENRRK
ncbi:hypothetical protein KKG46_03400 [Patescibacteria group bacterium]|nr:hypothetical protein [Patescibacteria group bacterium]